ncbi:hypothetical protein I6A84_42415 [Frankia sp. CNm7]|uniref:Uncharacterized protein n=1 Tax=Frankia nepalensis TaxID=1836974 RepID=A0A937UTM8_9ACTN|nr:hypothetical protein [Frankia nepalensis]MBL7496020.1 hypothetical protein [Frankia nepalensis]MBL7514867.1 hypothetical protein [Frankia nepalensis]MBL7524519.1 hypothetical protein [Frankia nepalensis]MBL7631425.1 hypothetical protein [Frankia nepalensis]
MAGYLQQSQLPDCLRQNLKITSQEGTTVDIETGKTLSGLPDVTAAVRFQMRVQAGQRSRVVFCDVIFVFLGRVEARVTLIQLDSVPDPALERGIVRQLRDKLSRQ